MKYKVIIKPSAEKDLLNLPRRDYDKVRIRIGALVENPRPYGVIHLKTKDNYRIRVGNYRVIYKINDEIRLVEVLKVPRRNEGTYKGL